MSGLSPDACTSHLKSVALTVLELLAFNAQKFRDHVTLATPPIRICLIVHVLTVPGNMRVKFEDRSFNRFKLVLPVPCAYTHNHTYQKSFTLFTWQR